MNENNNVLTEELDSMSLHGDPTGTVSIIGIDTDTTTNAINTVENTLVFGVVGTITIGACLSILIRAKAAKKEYCPTPDTTIDTTS